MTRQCISRHKKYTWFKRCISPTSIQLNLYWRLFTWYSLLPWLWGCLCPCSGKSAVMCGHRPTTWVVAVHSYICIIGYTCSYHACIFICNIGRHLPSPILWHIGLIKSFVSQHDCMILIQRHQLLLCLVFMLSLSGSVLLEWFCSKTYAWHRYIDSNRINLTQRIGKEANFHSKLQLNVRALRKYRCQSRCMYAIPLDCTLEVSLSTGISWNYAVSFLQSDIETLTYLVNLIERPFHEDFHIQQQNPNHKASNNVGGVISMIIIVATMLKAIETNIMSHDDASPSLCIYIYVDPRYHHNHDARRHPCVALDVRDMILSIEYTGLWNYNDSRRTVVAAHRDPTPWHRTTSITVGLIITGTGKAYAWLFQLLLSWHSWPTACDRHRVCPASTPGCTAPAPGPPESLAVRNMIIYVRHVPQPSCLLFWEELCAWFADPNVQQQ